MKFLTLFVLILIFPIPAASANLDADEDIPKMEKVEIEQYSLNPVESLFIDEGKLKQLVASLEKKVYIAPENARINETGEIIDGEPGTMLDKEEFHRTFREAFYSDQQEKVLDIPVKDVFPKVNRELLEDISSNKLGSYYTSFNQNNKERSHNISLAAEAINNYVVFPGESFSFNEVVGERTMEKGYKRAPVIVKGELAEDIGGGICQVSSTLFNAVDLKGIQIIERYAHSKEVPYVPPGKDAAVSWWGPDFVFKNIYNQPLLIRAAAKNGNLMVSIYSSDTADFFKGD
ncbi:VanW family protein [Virgibacillus sp. YIM 98842]|uniref:VanW family protein n=1 Tax=Virgibacillus sp. YIM 98842 TaxID=2663533 RepID=UPI0013DCAACB|nr:VanW family protein [Virgibacillus sp. YIM 98842]